MNCINNINDDSILNTVKKLLGIAIDYDCFDQDIIVHINSTFAVLHQMGVGCTNGEDCFEIEDASTTWAEFIKDKKQINFVKTYVYLKVRMLFDPPVSSTLAESINNQIKELENRLYIREGGY